MDVFNHFSCYTRLPVLLSDLIEHILETGVVSTIKVFALDLDPKRLRGFCAVWSNSTKDGQQKSHAWIGYSKHLTREEARLVIAKELLHLLDNHAETAQQREQVNDLVDQVAMGLKSKTIDVPAISDRMGELYALTVLLPRDALEELKAKGLSVDTIARLARLPEDRVELALSETWARVLDGFGILHSTPESNVEPEFPFSTPDKIALNSGDSGS